ncbi:MAG: rhodanese-like domain-containing protein [Erysipelotrichales bacterium]|nr:rhodanese-like domain-containing protein [Erysipelotrichales bacterium]
MKKLKLCLAVICSLFLVSCQRLVTVNFETDGNFTIEAQVISRNERITKPSIYQSGFLLSWYREKEFINPWNFSDDLVQETMTLFLKRTAIDFPIIFFASKGLHANPASFTVEDEFNLLPAFKEGYEFLGWFKEAELINQILKIERGTVGMKVLHAKYRKLDIRNEYGFFQITPERAKEIMLSDRQSIILDVRNSDEFEAGHIADAILIPLPELTVRALLELKDLNKIILVYCRSGVRSVAASKILAELGFTNIFEFGGILDWPFGLVTN